MTRIEGEPISAAMSELAMISIGLQLAARAETYLSCPTRCLQNQPESTSILTGTVLTRGMPSPGPIQTLLRLHVTRLGAELRGLETEDRYARTGISF